MGVNQDGGQGADIYVINLVEELVNLICLGDVSVNGVDKLGMSVNEKTWMKFADEKIKLVGCRIWMNNCGNSERLQEYALRRNYP